MTENISYIEDEEEMTRRSMMQPPPAVFLAPPAFLKTSANKEDRKRQQKSIDEASKKWEDKFKEYRDLFAKDFRKGIAAHYLFLSQSNITDLERAIENITPATTNVMTNYRLHEGKTVQQIRT